ncbi:hypothetical protein BCV69DRAFT_21642 [Microstroma glucosiphilum]|uniref:FIST domain-containing protein n=1 Tax=Pseudomicrostroma glucosiphilum TaxID=1684307 RepID=A0A316UGV1_9BASI|nr:hypothetical protein BCV69DRAFT_21642 [Pseudomicrostroma glucosiphilum]PWN24154.1 hypothetical protein BCV69DRAFT_21642 [Pseudomicrostroma glucosiphilum]
MASKVPSTSASAIRAVPIHRRAAGSVRWYASAASPAGKSTPASSKKKEDKYADSPWKKPLASTQTLSLFSTSPKALLFALEQSLRGALGALLRSDPQGGHSTDPRDYLLIFAVDKSLPKDVLAETIRLMRDVPIAHVGVLSHPVPGTLLPASAVSDQPQASSSSSLSPPESYHSVSLSLLPSTLVRPFYSQIKGIAPVQAGRWATGKASFDETQSRMESLDADLDGRQGGDWKNVWGRENAEGKLPEEFDDLKSSSHLLTLILGSDVSPQGLLEGLDSRFPASPLLGSFASNTFFETGGREATLFHRGPSSVPREAEASTGQVKAEEGKIHEKGAVGLFFRTPGGQDVPVQDGQARPRVDVEVPWRSFKPLGARRRVTRAKGNIVSELAGANACQQFLRDVAARDKKPLPVKEEDLSMEAKARGMDKDEQRLLSKGVGKEEDFWAVLWEQQDQPAGDISQEHPLLVSRILSGHPSRGTISLGTDLELSVEGVSTDPLDVLGAATTESLPSASSSPSGGDKEFYLQFFQKMPDEPKLTPQKWEETALTIPGKDLAAWRLPRFLFLNAPANSTGSSQATGAASQASASPSTASSGAGGATNKTQVHALPNLFVLASEGGIISRDPSLFAANKAGSSADAATSAAKGAVEGLKTRSRTWKMDGARGWADLRGRTA